MYVLSIFKVSKKFLKQMDRKIKQFLWQEYENNRKGYALIKWDKICQTQRKWGMCILDLDQMNNVLLVKWL